MNYSHGFAQWPKISVFVALFLLDMTCCFHDPQKAGNLYTVRI